MKLKNNMEHILVISKQIKIGIIIGCQLPNYISWIFSCQSEIPWKGSRNGDWIRSFDEMCCIVGRDLGLECMHLSANHTTRTTSLATCWSRGDGRRESNMSVSIMFWADEEDNKVKSSLGCFPIIVSSATTPKL